MSIFKMELEKILSSFEGNGSTIKYNPSIMHPIMVKGAVERVLAEVSRLEKENAKLKNKLHHMDRFLCPDHMDKPIGECVICKLEGLHK